IMHWCIFSSIVVLTFVTAQVGIQDDLNINFLHGDYYLFFSFYADLFRVIGLIGVVMALYRRYFSDFHRIRWDERLEDHAIIVGLGLVLLTGFWVEGFRLYVMELETNPEWARWSFGRYLIVEGIELFELSEGQALAVHE